MQPKGAIAILAAFFLVAVSSWTAACQLSCSLGTSSQCECPLPSKTVPHSHPRMTPACMSGVTSELSDAAYSAQCATTSGAMQLQAALAVGIVPAVHVTLTPVSRIDTSPPEQLSATPSPLSLRI
jgi:hypothetical protein